MNAATTNDWHHGMVVKYNNHRFGDDGNIYGGYGFVAPDNGTRDVLVERRAIKGNENLRASDDRNRTLDKGQRVRYLIVEGHEPPRARYVELHDETTNDT